MSAATERIRALNDELRRNLPNGQAVMTTGVAALGPDAVARIVKTIEVYDNFCHANDPYQEHDFGSFEADGHTIVAYKPTQAITRARIANALQSRANTISWLIV